MSSPNPTHVPVLIVGGGIVGLTASLFLSHLAIPCLLIERHASASIHPRSRSVNARTMEIFRGINLSTAVREAGGSLSPSMGIHSGTRSMKEVIDPLPRKEGKREFPFAKVFSETGSERGAWGTQDSVEPVLLGVARERGVDARFYTECLGVEQDEECITATLKDRSSNKTYTVTADYLIAADGASSPIRESLGIKRTGRGDIGNLLNILFHTSPSLSPFVKNREFSLLQIETPEVTGLLTSINNAERWIFHLSYSPSKGEKPSDYPPERCKELIKLALGMPDVEVEIKSILPWQACVRVAERVREGRIFIAGDAAHQMPPYAGQGANSGIADVHNLAWKLAAVLKNQANPELLSTYESERLPVGKYVAEKSGEAADGKGLILWKKDLKTMTAVLGRLSIMSGYGYTYEGKGVVAEDRGMLGGWSWRSWSLPGILLGLDGRPGSRAPHVWVEREGKKISTTDLFGKGFVLLAGSEGGEWLQAARRVSETLKGVEVKVYCLGPNGEVVEKERKWETAAGISSTGALLVRPDGFVAWRVRRIPVDGEKKLEEAMKQVMLLLIRVLQKILQYMLRSL